MKTIYLNHSFITKQKFIDIKIKFICQESNNPLINIAFDFISINLICFLIMSCIFKKIHSLQERYLLIKFSTLTKNCYFRVGIIKYQRSYWLENWNDSYKFDSIFLLYFEVLFPSFSSSTSLLSTLKHTLITRFRI